MKLKAAHFLGVKCGRVKFSEQAYPPPGITNGSRGLLVYKLKKKKWRSFGVGRAKNGVILCEKAQKNLISLTLKK